MSLSLQDSPPEPWLQIVRDKVDAIRFGSVQIVIHDDRVTLVESTEKTRFTGPASNTVIKVRPALSRAAS